MGLACPLPVVNAKDAIAALQDGDMVNVLVDNEIAVQNLEKFSKVRGHEFSSKKIKDGEYEATLIVHGKADGSIEAKEEQLIESIGRNQANGIVVVMNSNHLGIGDDKLGAALMKSFFFSLTKSDVLPQTMLFYNSGAFLTCEGSSVLEDIKNLACAGVQIMTCGTCLDFYGLKDKLQVGTVTNMYEIVDVQMNASKILKP